MSGCSPAGRTARIRSIRRRASSYYELPEFGVRMPFRPTEFTQVNYAMNRVLVSRACAARPAAGRARRRSVLRPGQFLAAARAAGADVIGFEGNRSWWSARAQNAAAQRPRRRSSRWWTSSPSMRELAAFGPFDKLLIDPPREGAVELVKSLPDSDGRRRIVYVSCDPATLARDAGVLVHDEGFQLAAAGVVNMFPHTAHVEASRCSTSEKKGAPQAPFLRRSSRRL